MKSSCRRRDRGSPIRPRILRRPRASAPAPARRGDNGLRPHSRRGGGLRGHGLGSDGGAGGRGRRGDPGSRLFLDEQLLLSLDEPLRFLRDLPSGGCDVVLFRRESLLAVHEFAVPSDLRLEGRLLLFKELHDLLLPRRDLGLPSRYIPRVNVRVRVATGGVLLALHERLEAFREFLLARDELVLLREDALPRRLELLFALINRPFLLLELLLSCAQAFLASDDRVPLLRDGGALLFEGATVPLDLGRLLLERGVPLSELLVLGLQAFCEFLQCVQRVWDRCFGHLRCLRRLVRRAEPPRRRRVNGSHQDPPVSKIGPRTVRPPLRTSIACFSIE